MSTKEEWHRSDGHGSTLLYTLRQDGWRRGEPVMINDVMIRIEPANGSDTDIEPIVERVMAALSSAPATKDKPEGVRDGYEKAIQELDLATGGDGEFIGSTFPGETVDVPVMKSRIIERFSAVEAALPSGVRVEQPAHPVADGVEVKRYSLHTIPATGTPKMLERKDGMWVEFTDHQQTVDGLRAEISELHGRLFSEGEAVTFYRSASITNRRRAEDAEARVAELESLMRKAHAVMRECGWQLAISAEPSGDGVLEAACTEVEADFAEALRTNGGDSNG